MNSKNEGFPTDALATLETSLPSKINPKQTKIPAISDNQKKMLGAGALAFAGILVGVLVLRGFIKPKDMKEAVIVAKQTATKVVKKMPVVKK